MKFNVKDSHRLLKSVASGFNNIFLQACKSIWEQYNERENVKLNAMCWIVHKSRGKVSKELGRSIKHCIADRRLNEYLNNIMNKNQNAPFMLNSMAAFLSYTKLAL